MDEAHDTAYKQEQTPHYQTSRVAAQLARLHDAKLVMGTATPLVTDYYAFEQKNLPIIRMSTPALPAHEAAHLTLIDYRNKDAFTRNPWLANSLLDAIGGALSRSEQTLLFLNRRGSARLVLCSNCGWQALCPHCDVPLTFHQDEYRMRCHSCDFSDRVPSSCPECNAAELIFRNIGTKALEAEIARLFPDARLARFDRDTAARERLHQQFERLHSGDIDIVIGTQAIAKGFDLPKLAVVGIIQADSGLQLPDFNAGERTFQLLSQVSGRVGRGHRTGHLFVQTYDPDSPLIQWALHKNYAAFYKHELEERRQFRFPPFYYLLKLSCSRAGSKAARQACEKLAATLAAQFPGLIIEGPAPRFIEKIAGKYAWQLIIKASRRDHLLKVIAALPANVSHDLDPSDLL
jgi:primosomal protein N' (replication factor Y)